MASGNPGAVHRAPAALLAQGAVSPQLGTLLRDNSVTGSVVSSSTRVDYWEFWTPGSYNVTGNLMQDTRKRNNSDIAGVGLLVATVGM